MADVNILVTILSEVIIAPVIKGLVSIMMADHVVVSQ